MVQEGGEDDLDHHRHPPHLLPLHLPCRRGDPGGHRHQLQPGSRSDLHHELALRDTHTSPLWSHQLLIQGTGAEQILGFLSKNCHSLLSQSILALAAVAEKIDKNNIL